LAFLSLIDDASLHFDDASFCADGETLAYISSSPSRSVLADQVVAGLYS
jgi:hypothetical protein